MRSRVINKQILVALRERRLLLLKARHECGEAFGRHGLRGDDHSSEREYDGAAHEDRPDPPADPDMMFGALATFSGRLPQTCAERRCDRCLPLELTESAFHSEVPLLMA